ncbi:hypothetical protein CIW53_16205 [Rhodanobacter sp. T12-5]|nr:hypothetical protein CIW53_16205 [Rhodanobacter sp. T12-5]
MAGVAWLCRSPLAGDAIVLMLNREIQSKKHRPRAGSYNISRPGSADRASVRRPARPCSRSRPT